MLVRVPESVLISFFERHIAEVFETLERQLSNSYMEDMRDDIIERINAFSFLQLMYANVAAKELTTETGRLFVAYNRSAHTKVAEPRKLTMSAVSAYQNTRKKVFTCRDNARGSPERMLRQDFLCAAYNAACAVIQKTQSLEKFFHGMLFKNNQETWKVNVDTDDPFVFPVELKQRFERRSVVTLDDFNSERG